MANPPILYYVPKISAEPTPEELGGHITLLYQKLNNHTQAMGLLATTKGVTSTVTNIIEGGAGSSGGGGTTTSTILSVNDQSGVTSYSPMTGDNGALIVLSATSPIAVTLNSESPPWGCFITNQGTSTATLTPTSGTISYAGNPSAASYALVAGDSCIVAYDGTEWWVWAEVAGVTSLNGETGDVTLLAGSNITITPSGSNITIAATGGAGGVVATQTVVPASFGTTRQNTSGNAMFVSGYAVTPSGGSIGHLNCVNGPTSSPTLVVFATEATATVAGGAVGFGFFVPDTYYYQINVSGAIATSGGNWVETVLS